MMNTPLTNKAKRVISSKCSIKKDVQSEIVNEGAKYFI